MLSPVIDLFDNALILLICYATCHSSNVIFIPYLLSFCSAQTFDVANRVSKNDSYKTSSLLLHNTTQGGGQASDAVNSAKKMDRLHYRSARNLACPCPALPCCLLPYSSQNFCRAFCILRPRNQASFEDRQVKDRRCAHRTCRRLDSRTSTNQLKVKF